jgi:hypothetical protein
VAALRRQRAYFVLFDSIKCDVSRDCHFEGQVAELRVLERKNIRIEENGWGERQKSEGEIGR